MSCAAIRSALALAPFSFIAFLVLGTKQAGAGARRAKLAAIQRVLSLALLWQIIAIDRRNWIPESDFQ